jgi:hypothetical protein
VDAPPAVIRDCQPVKDRVEAVQKARSESNRPETRELAKRPALFSEIRQPKGTYLLVPKVSSMGRNYMPVGFVQPKVIANGSALIVPKATLYHFGLLSSAMHMAWMRYTCGRMKSDYQYSSQIVYNNYPWPSAVTDKQREAVEAAAQAVLDARVQFPTSTLADLYDPLMMPAPLLKAHQALDRAVDRCYRPEPFPSDRHRVEPHFPHGHFRESVHLALADGRSLREQFPVAVDLCLDFVFLHVARQPGRFFESEGVYFRRAVHVQFYRGPAGAVVRGPVGFVVAVHRHFAAELTLAATHVARVDRLMQSEVAAENFVHVRAPF